MPPSRSGILSNRIAPSNINPSFSNVSSPLLTSKLSHVDSQSTLSPKPSQNQHPSIPSNLYSSPSPAHRTLTNVTNSVTDSPSLSLRSATNTNFRQETQQTLRSVKTDSASVRSTNSSTSSDDGLYPSSSSQAQQQQSSNFNRNQEASSSGKFRSTPGHTSSNQPGNFATHIANTTSSSTGTTISSTAGLPVDRVPSPSPSALSNRDREENDRVERELELKRKRLQIYVFVCRCVACPFNAKQSSDMARKYLKITLAQYGVIKERFLAFLNGKTHIEADEGKFINIFFYHRKQS